MKETFIVMGIAVSFVSVIFAFFFGMSEMSSRFNCSEASDQFNIETKMSRSFAGTCMAKVNDKWVPSKHVYARYDGDKIIIEYNPIKQFNNRF